MVLKHWILIIYTYTIMKQTMYHISFFDWFLLVLTGKTIITQLARLLDICVGRFIIKLTIEKLTSKYKGRKKKPLII